MNDKKVKVYNRCSLYLLLFSYAQSRLIKMAISSVFFVYFRFCNMLYLKINMLYSVSICMSVLSLYLCRYCCCFVSIRYALFLKFNKQVFSHKKSWLNRVRFNFLKRQRQIEKVYEGHVQHQCLFAVNVISARDRPSRWNDVSCLVYSSKEK